MPAAASPRWAEGSTLPPSVNDTAPAVPAAAPTQAQAQEGSGGCSVCVHCGRAAAQGLYREYSRDNIRLTRCAACGAVADPLVEREFLLVLLDLVLHRREAYRHLLLNRPPHCALGWRGLLRVACVLLVLDTHYRYAIYTHASTTITTAAAAVGAAAVGTAAAAGAAASSGFLASPEAADADTPAVQLRLLLRLCLLTLLEHAAFAALVVGGSVWLFWKRDKRRGGRAAADGGSSKAAAPVVVGNYTLSDLSQKLLQALLYPAFGRLLVPFIMVWDPAVAVAGVIGALVLSSQWQALHAVATSAPFRLEGEEGNGADVGKKKLTDAAPSSSWEPLVALPFVLGLVGRAALRLLLAGRVVALEGLGGGPLGGGA